MSILFAQACLSENLVSLDYIKPSKKPIIINSPGSAHENDIATKDVFISSPFTKVKILHILV